MKYLKFYVLLLVFTVVGCGSIGKFYPRENKLQTVEGLKTFYIHNITNPFPENKEYVDFTESLKHELNRAFLKKDFVEDQKTPDLKVNARVVYVDEGDAALRYFIGGGAGKGEAKVFFEMTDSEGVHLMEGTGTGSIVWDWWYGGSIIDISKCLAKDIVKQMKTGKFREKY